MEDDISDEKIVECSRNLTALSEVRAVQDARLQRGDENMRV